MTANDPSRTPVVAAVGQSIEREQIVDAVDLAERAARSALSHAPRVAERIERLSMVAVSFSEVGKAPARAVAERLGLRRAHCEVTTAGGQTPQWLVNRAAREIVAGELGATLFVGAEATRSLRAANPGANFLAVAMARASAESGDPVVGPPVGGVLGEAERQAELAAPAVVYPMFENARAHAAGRSCAEQRAHLAPLMARFSEIAARHPFAWFRKPQGPSEIAEVSDANRLTAEPYTRCMNSFPNVDLGAAVLVTSLEIAREAGFEEPFVFPWSGASLDELQPAARPDPGGSPALQGAAAAALAAAGVGVDDLAHIDLYSCFPVAVEAAAEALGVALDDPRDLTVTGGLPFFGGPGNNYSMHAIASVADRLREAGGVGYVSANGGYLSKHAVGVYGVEPPAGGFRLADTADAQAALRASARPVALSAEGSARVVASTVAYGKDGTVASAPAIAALDDGRRVVAQAETSLLPDLAGVNLVGTRVAITGSPPRYQL